jgi:hypothetical protein
VLVRINFTCIQYRLPLDSTGRQGARRILIPEVKRFGARDIKVGLLAGTAAPLLALTNSLFTDDTRDT